MIVFCVVRLLSKVTSVRFRQKEVMSVTDFLKARYFDHTIQMAALHGKFKRKAIDSFR